MFLFSLSLQEVVQLLPFGLKAVNNNSEKWTFNEYKIVNTDYRWYWFRNTHTHTHTHSHSFRVFTKNSCSRRKVKIYRRILGKRLQVWIQNSCMLSPLAGEFCVVNGEFSDLWCLMNTLLIGNKNATWHQTINGVFLAKSFCARNIAKICDATQKRVSVRCLINSYIY